MRARALGVLASGALVAAALPVIGASSAEALQSPVAFTANALSTYQTDGIAWAVASSQGKVFVGGRFSNVRPPGVVAGAGDPGEVARSNFVVLDAATGQPTSCQPAALLAGDPATASVRSLAVSPDGSTLYVGGYFSTFGGSNRGSLAALDIATCTVVSGFNPAPTGKVLTIAATESTVYYGGEFVSVNTGGTITARLHAAASGAVGQPGVGALLPWAPATESTATAGTNPPTYVNSPSVQALNVKPGGGEVVLGGDFERVNGVSSHGIASVSDSGVGANVWVNNSIVPSTSAVKSIAVDATGFYTGNEGTGSLQFDGRLAFDWATHAMRWRDICYGATQSVVVYQDALYSGSHAHNCSLMGEYPDGARHHLLAETLTVDPNPPVALGNSEPRPAKLAWFPDTNDGPADKCGVTPQLWECIGPRALAVAHTASQDYMYVVGEFSSVNGAAQQGITRFGQTSDAAPSTPVVVATSFVPGQVRVAWRPSLDLDNTDLTYTLQRGTSAGGPWTTLQSGVVQTSWFWDRPQMVYTDTGRTMGTTYWYRVSVTDGVTTKTSGVRSATVTNIGADLGGGSYGPSPYQAAVLGDDPELYLRYDEVGDVFLSDATENRSNVVLKGTATFGAGLLASDASRAVTLTGGYGQTLYSQKLEQPMTSFALETWFATSSTRGGKLIGFGNKQDYSSNAFDKQVWITNDGRLAFGVVSGGSKQVLVTDAPASGGTAYNDNLRHQVVAVQDASLGMRLYVDGALVKSNTVKTNQNNYAGYWHIGGDNLTSWSPAPTYACPTLTDPTCATTARTSFPFTGTLDETAVYHHALSAAQVANHYALADTVGTEVQALTPQTPTVSLGGPATGDTVSGIVPIQVVGHTTTGTTSFAQTLELLVNGAVVQTYTCPVDTYDCSKSFSWDTSGLGGSYSLTARITSTDALTATSAPAVTVTVPLPPTKPTATITDPSASALVGPGAVTVHATASTVEGSVSYPAAIELFVDGGASPVATAPCPGDAYDCAADIEWNTSGLVGNHTLKVRATATDGCSAVPSSCTGNLSSGVTVSVAALTRTVVTPLTTVRSRSGVLVKGRVTLAATGAAAPGIPVKVTATPAIGTPGSRTGTTDANGYFSVPFTVYYNTVFSAAAQATGPYVGSSTAVRQYVTGVPLCTLSATTVRAGVRDVMTCRLSGLPTATPVALQYLVAGKWRTLVKSTSRTGAAYIAFTIRAKGYWYLRTVIASNKTYYTSISSSVRVRII